MKGSKFNSGEIKKDNLVHANNAGMQGFLMNSRRDLFKDPRVRQALGLALDFEWINKALFHNQYTRTNSYFSNITTTDNGAAISAHSTLNSFYPNTFDVSSTIFETMSSVNGGAISATNMDTKIIKSQFRGNIAK